MESAFSDLTMEEVKIGIKKAKELVDSRTFIRYNKYLILKWSDINFALTETQINSLEGIINDILKYRKSKGKKEHKYIVINQELPFAERVWKLIEAHWEKTKVWK